VKNTELSPTASRVRYVIDGNLSGEITSFTPHYIENLTAGEHQLQLTLLDANNAPVAGMFNDTTRTITIAPDCKAVAPVTPPAATSGGTPPVNAPLVTTPTPGGPVTPPSAAPSEAPAAAPAK